MKTKQLPRGWKEVELKEILDYEQPTNYIVNSENYDDDYKTPVLTAGKSFILGHTDETDGIYKKLPVIIFDDFTTESKFVTFPFKVKSSAMKLLRPKNKLVDLKFIFLMMQKLRFNFSTHKRYYLSVYQNLKIPLPFTPEGEPDLKTQQKIVLILEKAEQLKEKRKKSVEVLDEYLKAVFMIMFGDPNSKKLQFSKKKFLNCIKKEASSNKLKIPQKDFLEEGRYPIVDQGDNIIAGYTNDETKVYSEKLPVVVFGDHTRVFKFIKFPFSIGADGTKILVPSEEFDPVYFYFCLKLFDIPSAGYSRHYKFLKEKSLILPPIELQQTFASIVKHVEKLKEKQKRGEIEGLFGALMQKAFQGELVK